MKGEALTDEDREEVGLRTKYAKKWLETHAPDRYRYELQESLPESAKDLSETQKKFLNELAKKLEEINDWNGQDIHTNIHDLVKSKEEYVPKECFQAIYTTLLNKSYGPQAGWFLSALKKEWLVSRFGEIK